MTDGKPHHSAVNQDVLSATVQVLLCLKTVVFELTSSQTLVEIAMVIKFLTAPLSDRVWQGDWGDLMKFLQL